jgi:hypothetical protein
VWAITGRADWASIPEIWANYALFLAIPAFGFGLSRSTSPLVPALWRGLAASFAFFVASNFVCFLASYPKTLAGLGQCYYMAIPFYGPTLASTLFFTMLLFSPLGVGAAQPVRVRKTN